MTTLSAKRAIVLVAATVLLATAADAAVIEGTVTDAAKHPLSGAMVSLRDDARGFYETVYADTNGHFRLATNQQGDLVVRGRKLSFADASQPVHLNSASSATVNLALTTLTDPADIADNLSSGAHFSKLPFDAAGPNSRAAMQMTCTNCHSLGTRFNRIPRLPEEWAAVVSRMLAYNVGVPSSAINDLTLGRSNLLAQGFDESLPKHTETQIISPEIFNAKVTEWAIPGQGVVPTGIAARRAANDPLGIVANDGPLPFGIAVSSRDGKLYATDNGMDRLLIIDPKGEDVLPAELTPPTTFAEVRIGAEGIAEAADGSLYFTAPASGMVGLFDPRSGAMTWTLLDKRSAGLLKIGKDGVVWWTHFWDDIAPDRAGGGVGLVGRFDPTTNNVKLIELPRNPPQDYIVPSSQPYTFGIAVDPNTGNVWYSKLYANKIGHIDAKTLAVTEFTPPQMGPRGMAFDKQGQLWVTFSGSSSIASLDPSTMKWQNYPLPTLAPEETDAPYSLAINPATQDVWVTSNQEDQAYRFIPSTRQFITYPMPTRGTWMRDIAFTADGLVCATSGPLPTINIEGGAPEVICIDPGDQNR